MWNDKKSKNENNSEQNSSLRFSTQSEPVLKQLCCFLFIGFLFLSADVSAQGSDSLELVYSDAFDRRGRADQSLATFKHSRTWSIGDNFYFFDLANLGNYENAGNTYFEWGPRLSPGKIFNDKATSFGPIRDVYLIGELDYIHNKFVEKAIYLAGLSVDVAIPGFRFFKLHLFNRNDPTLPGHTEQMTIVWNFPFSLWNQDFVFEGFYDLTGSEANTASNYHAQPQLLWQMHERIFVGLEYMYWHNKTGIAGFNESAMQGVFRVNF
jgi:nucleoside-specific outer membrane channel protein Tsx